MLPYTPLHHLLLENLELIVATSSNQKDAPIMKDDGRGHRPARAIIVLDPQPADRDAGGRFGGQGRRTPPRFSSGGRAAMSPIPRKSRTASIRNDAILALGGELKDTVSIYKNGYVVTSQFLGDLDEYGNHLYFEETVAHLTRLFDVKPACVVSDLHPDFHTTRFARTLGLPHFRVQHHHAHVLAALLEHGLASGDEGPGRLLGRIRIRRGRNGLGRRVPVGRLSRISSGFAHFEPVPLPGGDLAAKQPWRMALAYLARAGYPETVADGDPGPRRSDKKVRGVLRHDRPATSARRCPRAAAACSTPSPL